MGTAVLTADRLEAAVRREREEALWGEREVGDELTKEKKEKRV